MITTSNPTATGEIRSSETGSSSLLALAQAQSRPMPPQGVQAATNAEIFLVLSQVLELLYRQLVEQKNASVAEKSLDAVSERVTAALTELGERLEESEERQRQTLEATLKHLAIQREAQAAESLLERASVQMQTQLEVNRLLRVMWLGTGLAAAGAGCALVLLR